ncbi:MAG TPA: DUF2784 domain-containing protein [Methylophilaceae bacterium]|nr:DUF2784 domain-containing protein [Methylophilaceae bacterium]
MYYFLAQVVLLVHGAFILFVVLGGLLALKWPRLAWVHLPAAIWGAVVEFMSWPCPLTPLEKRFLELAGRASYEGGFIEHYLWPIIYPAGLTQDMQLILGSAVIVVNSIIYGIVIFRLRRQRLFGRG